MKDILGILQVVSHLDKMVAFYTGVLHFTEVERFFCTDNCWAELFQIANQKAEISRLRLGKEDLYLIQFSPGHGKPYPMDSQSHDLWFQHMAIVVSNMEEAHAFLMKHKVQSISLFHQTIPKWNAVAGGIQAFYFRSPDGHPLELLYFPPGKGNPIWQNGSPLFLGIDHTAIGVSRTEESLSFYQDFLGMRIVGRSLNYGEEQEKLSGVVGAKVKISTLQFPNSLSMGIEFLEYLYPLDGKRKPKNTEAHHLSETQTIIAVEDLSSLVKTKADLSLQPIISLKEGLGFAKGLMTLDPDGHRILLVERSKTICV